MPCAISYTAGLQERAAEGIGVVACVRKQFLRWITSRKNWADPDGHEMANFNWPLKKATGRVQMFDCTCKESTLILTRQCGRSEIVGYWSNVFIDLAHLSRDNLIPSLCWVYWLCQRFQYSEMFYHDKQWLEDALRCTQCVHTRKARVNFFQSVQLHSFLSRNLSLLRHIAKMSSGPSAMCGHSCWASCSVQKSQWTEVERERESVRRLVQIDGQTEDRQTEVHNWIV